MTVTFNMNNLGSGSAIATTTRLRLNQSSSGTTLSDISLGDVSTPAIAAYGVASGLNKSVTIPPGTAAGTYYIWAVADNGGVLSESNYQNDYARSPALTVNISSTFFLSFPISGLSYDVANISSVFDHAMTGANQPGTSVMAFTGEQGTIKDPAWHTDNGYGLLYGYTKDGGSFVINGHYTGGGGVRLDYEGHTGYDFPYSHSNEVVAAAGGTLHKVTNAYNTIYIDHQNGYFTYYLHMYPADTSGLVDGQTVTRGQHLGYCGSQGAKGEHLHFTVMNGVDRVDPYGWSGSGEDPYYTHFGVRNEFLWSASGNPAPSISSVSPNPITYDAANGYQTLIINGANFVNKPTVTLTWTVAPLPPAGGYIVPAAQVTFISSSQLSISIKLGKAVDNWTVKVTNPDNKFSSAVGFQVVSPVPSTPTNPNPANGAVLGVQPTVFDWADTSGASKYDVYLKVGSGASAKVGTDLPSSQWSPIQSYAGSSFSWYVVAKNGSNSTTGPSWSYTVNTAQTQFQVGSRVMAVGNVLVRNAPPDLSRKSGSDKNYDQCDGVHGTIVSEPMTGTTPDTGHYDTWRQIDWDSGIDGWCASSVLTNAPLSGDISQPNLSSSFYTSANIFWQAGQAPVASAPPNCQLGSALGNCTWYAHGRLRELGYDTTQLSLLNTNACKWNAQATTGGILVDSIPTVGSIAQISSGAGHVAVVESVNADETVTLTESAFISNTPLPNAPWNFLWRHRTVSKTGWNFIHISKSGIPSLSVSPATQPVSASSGSTSFSIANVGGGVMSYSASAPNVAWLHITSGQSGGNSGTISVSYDANAGAQRSGTIVVTSGGTAGTSKTLTVSQLAGTGLGEPASLGVVFDKTYNFDDGNHFNNRPKPIDSIVIHTTEGPSAASGIKTLFDRNLSAHYVIDINGDIYQLVDLSKRAWHATYYNDNSIGIEMAGFASSATTWNTQNMAALANLVAYLSAKYNIKIIHPSGDACSYPDTWFTETGLVGHSQVQPSPAYPKTVNGDLYADKYDPGVNFPWTTFVAAVQSKSSSDATPPSISSFSVTPSLATAGDNINIGYTTSDSGGAGLKQVVLRRTSGDGSKNDLGWHDIQTATIAGNGPISGSFTDVPIDLGTYRYGIAVFDKVNNSVDERQAGKGPLSAEVRAAGKAISVNGNLVMGSVQVGVTAYKMLTLSNLGALPVFVSSIDYSSGSGLSGSFSGSLPAGASTNVPVTFAPTATADYSGTVTVHSDAGTGTNAVVASGSGVSCSTPTRVINLSGDLSFGTVPSGTTVQRTLTISNTGNTSLLINGIEYPMGFSGFFSGSIAAGASTNVTVTFAPTAGTSYNGPVVINSDMTSGANTINAFGSGIVPPTNQYYMLTVISGSSGNSYTNGQQITIVANALAGRTFDRWTGSIQYVANITSATTTVTMPAQAITVTATYKTIYYALTVIGGAGSGACTNGQKVTITATVPVGCKFDHWNDDNTNASRIITMPASPVVYTASFKDIQNPVLKLSSPLTGVRLTSPAVTVTGKATDNSGAADVLIQLNGSSWTTNNALLRTTNWIASLTLQPGSNSVKVCARDTMGNSSATNTLNLTYVVCGTLTIQTNGVGTVTRSPTGTPEVNKTYTLTAAAGTGSVFSNWTGAVNNPTNKVTTFTMTSNMTIRANFTDTAKPTVAISSPTAGQRVVTNGLVVAKGTALDNKGVTAVWVQLNSNGWMQAVGTNSWTAALDVVPGPNTIRAYSEDAMGNHSLTSAPVSFSYVVAGHLILGTNGLGTITRSPASAPEVGVTYTLTAAPAAGYGFTNWTGDAVNNPTNKVVTFIMTSNKTVTANFMDIAKPTVAISSPTAGQRVVTNGLVVAKGTALDNKGVTAVWVQLNSNGWMQAVGTNSWTAALDVVPGPNTIRAYSEDAMGNHSLTSAPVSFSYVVAGHLILGTNGLGTITRSPASAPEVGVTYTLTAAPAAGYGFTNWTGDAVNNPTNKVVTFIMTSNKTVTANFTDTAKPTVAISSPTAGQRVVTNGLVVAKGTALDNKGVTAVWVQLNSNGWMQAVGTNSWTAALDVVPGPNTIRAYSEDAMGNHSLTSAPVSFSYVVAGHLILGTNGLGTITRSPASAPEVGVTYTLTAAPAAGYGFTNWTGDAVNNPTNKVVTFIMTSNKTVTANFMDIAKPTVAITLPTANLRITNTNPVYTVKGTATDNSAVAAVKVRLNSGDWTNAVTTNAWKNWSVPVTLTGGTNTIRAYSIDTGGNNSSTSSVVCTYVMTVPTFEYNGHIYKLVTADKATWTAAKAAAAASVLNGMTGHLAVIETPAENAAIFEALNPSSNSSVNIAMPRAAYTHPDSGARGIWIGASDSAASVPGASEGKFFWIGRGMIAAQNFWTGGQNGSAVPENFENWGLGMSVVEPDNWNGRQHAVAMQIDDWLFGTAGQWNDLDGNQPQAYLIEYDRDEADIRAVYAEMKRAHEQHDSTALETLFSFDYYVHQGKLFSDWYSDPAFIESFKTFAFNITRITIFGNNAKVSGSVSVVFNDGSSALVSEPDVAGNSPGFGHLWKTTNSWQVVGDQKLAMTSLITSHQANPGNEQYSLWMLTKSSIAISSVSVSGPGLPETALVQDPYSGEFSAESSALPTNPVPAVGSTYSFLIQFADGFQETYQETIKSWVPKAPAITLTGGDGSVTVHWSNISGSVPGADHYLVRVMGDSANWAMDYLPLSRTSAVFNEDGRAQGSLIGGQNYYAQIFIFNKNGDYAHQWVSFTMPSTAPQMSACSGSLVLSGSSDLSTSSTVTSGDLGGSACLTNTSSPSSLSLNTRQAAITVDGTVEDWANIPRMLFAYPVAGTSVTQEVAKALDGNNIALLLSGCPFSTSDTVLVYFKLRLSYGDGDDRHSVDLWTSGSVLYGMVDGQVIAGLEAILLNGVLEVKIPVEQVPSQVTIEEVGCGMDIGTGALTELFKYTF